MKDLLNKKLKASALQFAILVSVLVAIILSCFLLFVHTTSSFKIQSNRVLSNIENSNKGIEYLFGHQEVIMDSLKLFIEDSPILLSKTFWGSFEKVSSTSGEGSHKFEKIALLGTYESSSVTGIYLEDNSLPLVLAGHTRIEGNSFTPQDIIKPGNISGNYFSGGQLIYGNRDNSESTLPALDPDWKSYIEEMVNFLPNGEEAMVELKDLKNSFFENRIIVYDDSKIILDQELLGNIIIKSNTEIEVSQFAKLDQVLLIAPKVTVQSNFRGNVHVIGEKVQVGENVTLVYPSSIVVFKNLTDTITENPEMEPKIEIGMDSNIEGNLIYLNSEEENTPQPDVVIKESSIVEGNFYCEGYFDLRGTVKGSVFTKYFVAQQSGSLYINHIYNARILNQERKAGISGLLFEGKEKNVAAWLY